MDNLNSNKTSTYAWAFVKTGRNEYDQLGHQESAICQFYFLTLPILQYRESLVIVKQSNLRIGSTAWQNWRIGRIEYPKVKNGFLQDVGLYAGEKITQLISIKLAVNISTTPMKMHKKDI